MAGEQFSLCWDNFHKNMSSGMHSLLESEDLVDVTLAVEGKYLKAHKMVLSVCSPYFRELFQMNPCKHPIVFMKDVSYTAMNDLLTFMYQGEVQVNQEQLTMFIKTAEALQIKGLTNDGNNESTEISDDHVEEVVPESKASATITHENDVVLKPTTKVKKSTSHPSAKRQRIASPVVDKRSPVTSKIESKPTEQHTTDHLIQFKMEPYEADQSDQAQAEGYEENPDDNFADDGVDEAHMDDSEYQETILKGEEEPQAGTSGDGMGESQATLGNRPRKKKAKSDRIVLNGFVYHTSVVRHNPAVRYLVCSKYLSAGCRGRAILPINADHSKLRITQAHNHPPDNKVEDKFAFMSKLKMAVQNVPNASLKTVFDELVELYPKISNEYCYESLRSSLRRWRKEADH